MSAANQTGTKRIFLVKESSTIESIKTEKLKARGLRKYIPIVTFVPVIGIMLVLFFYRDAVAELGNWGYLGAFLIGLVANATVLLPMPSLLLLFTLGITFNPVLVGLFGATGGALGEMTGYAVGYSGNTLVRNYTLFRRVEKWMGRWGAATVFVFALIPCLPIDIAGIVAGTVRFRVWKFLVASFAGKAILYIGLTITGAWGWNLIQKWFT